MKRSKVSALPAEIRKYLDGVLIEGNFSGYAALEADLAARGFAISKSSIHRYGANLERRIQAIKASTEAAIMINDAAPDDEDKLSGAVISMIQSEIFNTILQFQEANDAEPEQRVKLLSAAAKNVATLTRASVGRKRWQNEWRTTFAQDLIKIESAVKTDLLTPAQVIARIRAAYGLDQPPAAPGGAAP